MIVDEITAYLTTGGLFNPELADHDAVRDLLIRSRDRVEELEKALQFIKAELETSAPLMLKYIAQAHGEIGHT